MLEEHLSRAEKLKVDRDRRRETPAQAAARHGVKVDLYKAWERGKRRPRNVDLGGLHPWEHYLVLRLRAGLTRKKVADMMGVAVMAVVGMERGKQTMRRLVEFWGDL